MILCSSADFDVLVWGLQKILICKTLRFETIENSMPLLFMEYSKVCKRRLMNWTVVSESCPLVVLVGPQVQVFSEVNLLHFFRPLSISIHGAVIGIQKIEV